MGRKRICKNLVRTPVTISLPKWKILYLTKNGQSLSRIIEDLIDNHLNLKKTWIVCFLFFCYILFKHIFLIRIFVL